MRKFIEPVIHIVTWVGLYILAILFIRTIGPFNKVDGTLLIPITIGNIINAAIFYSITLFLIPGYATRNQIKRFIIGLLVVFVGFTMLETIIDFYLMTSLYSDKPEPFYSVALTNAVVHLLYTSLALGYGFTRRWVVSENKKQELVREKLTAELNFLKTQLNPHFLFNVLNMAYSSASRKGDDQTADIIEKLSVLMRYMIYDSNVDRIEVEKEIEFIRNYINLQKMRFSNDLPVTVTFTVEGHYTGYRIAPLILIPFIENAFKYGVKLEQNSEIHLTLNFQNGEMEFSARNPIFKNGSTSDSKNSGIGIKNTQKRLAILYPSKHKLNINNNGKDFLVKLLLNLE